MRLEELNSFACLFGADDRGAQEQSLRGPSSPTHVSKFVLGITLLVFRVPWTQPFRVHREANMSLLDGTCAQTHTHGTTTVVLNRMTAVCAELRWLARVFGTSMPNALPSKGLRRLP